MRMLYVQGVALESVGAAQGLGPPAGPGLAYGRAEDGPRGKVGRAGSRPNGGGGGGHNHPFPAVGGLGGHKPPLGEDQRQVTQAGVYFGPRWVTTTPPPPCQAESLGAVQGLGLRPAQGGQMHAPHAGAASKRPVREEWPVEQAKVGRRAPGRVHGRASMEET